MRLPAVAIAAVFAAGAVLGHTAWLSQRISSPGWLVVGFISVTLLIVVGVFLAKRSLLWFASALSLVAWLLHVLFLAAALLLCVCGQVPRLWRGWAWRAAATALALSALAVALFPFAPRWSAGKLELTVLDVGQGDSLFVVSPHGRTMLIDGGGVFNGFAGREEHNGTDPGEEAVSPYLWSRGFQKLDVVALTHAHQDHIGGLTAILENFRVGTLWIGREVSSAALANLEKLAAKKGIPIVHEMRGKPFSWDGVEREFLWPESAAADPTTEPKPESRN